MQATSERQPTFYEVIKNVLEKQPKQATTLVMAISEIMSREQTHKLVDAIYNIMEVKG